MIIDKYNQFYPSNLQPEYLCEVRVRNWPRNRYEAIVYCPGNGGSVLDIGCGNGYLLYQMRNSYAQLVGLEVSSQRLAQAEINLARFNFKAILGSAEDMPHIASETIDRIVSADTIEHIPDVYAAVSEMYRVLKPGGQLVINTPNIAFIKKRCLLLLGRFPSTSQPNEGLGSDILFDGGHLHYFTYRSLSNLLSRAGFSITQKLGYGIYGRLHNVWPELLSGGVQLIATKPVTQLSKE